MARRSYGSGSLYTRTDAAGREHWYAKWRSIGRQVKRKLGLKRAPGSREGMTRSQAEAELRRLMSEVQAAPKSAGERLTVAELATRYVAHIKRQGRKLSTQQDVASDARVHLEPFFGERSLDSISSADVDDLISTLESKGLAPKTIRDIIGTLSALFNYARAPKRRWATENPCEGVELPKVRKSTEIRFLTLEEVDAVIVCLGELLEDALDVELRHRAGGDPPRPPAT